MSELTEKEPCLKRIAEKRSGRDLLLDVHPLEANPPAGKTATVTVQLENGPEAPIDLTVTSDRDWLKPSREKLFVMGGETADFDAIVDANGTGEFANLCFTWSGSSETFREYVLVWRKGKVQPPPLPRPPATPGKTQLPAWMKD